jgi:chromosomal replication initiation ATPase DnaA
MEQMSAISRPGISIVDEKYIIDVVKEAFGLKLYTWVTTRSRVLEYRIPRQVLMACLLDFCQYSQQQASDVCFRDHATALYSHTQVHEVLMNDKVYGPIVNNIYKHLREVR